MINTKLARTVCTAENCTQKREEEKNKSFNFEYKMDFYVRFRFDCIYGRWVIECGGKKEMEKSLPYSMRRPCAENLKMPVLSMRFDEPATFRTRPANSWIDLFNLSRRFFSARLRASRPLLL